jgi:hypothetical protein
MRNFKFLSCLLVLTFSFSASAIMTEIGASYNYKKSSFDADNISEQQSATGSLSFYFWEQVALEMSYTNGLYVKKEQQPNYSGSFLRTTSQYTDVYGADLIFVLADRKAVFQPYLKGGAAYVKIRQVVQDTNAPAWELDYSGLSPSYGAGFKFFLTEAFAFRVSYDAIQTPADNSGTKVTDITGRVGVSWMF